jgi:hypothetical protein
MMGMEAVRSRNTQGEFLMSWKTKRMMIIGAVALLAAVPVFAQNPELQQKLAAVKQALRKTSKNCCSINGSRHSS